MATKQEKTTAVTGGRKIRKHENRPYRAAYVQFGDFSLFHSLACACRQTTPTKPDSKLYMYNTADGGDVPCSTLQTSVGHLDTTARLYSHPPVFHNNNEKQKPFQQVEQRIPPSSAVGNSSEVRRLQPVSRSSLPCGANNIKAPCNGSLLTWALSSLTITRQQYNYVSLGELA